MKDYRAVTFFDLDGTLLDGRSKITKEIAEAMQELQKNGVLPVIATGRTEMEIDGIMADASIDSAIVMNGQFIRVEGKEIYSSLISQDICHRMYEETKKLGHQLSYYNARNIWCTAHSDILIKAYQFIHSDVPPIYPTAYETEAINMLLVLSEDGDEAYHEAFPELTFFRNGPFSIDIVNHGVNKGTGIKELKKQLGLTDVPTYGFGDGPNDVALLEACDYKIAMGNARPQLKDLADYVTAKNTDGGIIQALKHFELI